MHEGARRTHALDAAVKLAQGMEIIEVIQLRGVTAPARVQRETKPLPVADTGAAALPADMQRGDYRQFLVHQGETEFVFLGELGVAPAFRAVELGNQRLGVLMPTW
jgi:hypothetical protein